MPITETLQTRRKILYAIDTSDHPTAEQIAKKIDKGVITVFTYLRALIIEGHVEYAPARKGDEPFVRRYRLAEKR